MLYFAPAFLRTGGRAGRRFRPESYEEALRRNAPDRVRARVAPTPLECGNNTSHVARKNEAAEWLIPRLNIPSLS